MPSIHCWCGLPLTCCPSHLASMRLFSRLPSFFIMWPKYLSLCLTIVASRELSRAGLLHHRLVCFFLGPRNLQCSPPAPQLKHYLCNHLSSFLIVQDSHLYIAMGKTNILTILILDSLLSPLLFIRYLSFTIATLARLSLLLISSEDVLSLIDQTAKEVEILDHLYFISIHLEFTSVIYHHHFESSWCSDKDLHSHSPPWPL